MHQLVARLALVAHLWFVAFAILGGFLAWLAPWVFLPHLASAFWGGCQVIFRRACPLSLAEDWGRAGAGSPPLHERGFIAHYFEDRLYPAAWSRRVEALVCGLVVVSWVGFALL